MKNPRYIKAFENAMARLGKPLTAIRQQGPGRPQQVYHFEEDGQTKTVVVRTHSKKPTLLASIKRARWILDIEAFDYVASVHVVDPEHQDRVAIFLIPTAIAAPAMKANQQAWLDADQKHSRDNPVFELRFDDAPAKGRGWHEGYGYARKWAPYKLDVVELPQVSTSQRLADTGEAVVDYLKRKRDEIAYDLDLLPEAVNISIDLLKGNQTAFTR
jgi:hypothetical protein